MRKPVSQLRPRISRNLLMAQLLEIAVISARELHVEGLLKNRQGGGRTRKRSHSTFPIPNFLRQKTNQRKAKRVAAVKNNSTTPDTG